MYLRITTNLILEKIRDKRLSKFNDVIFNLRLAFAQNSVITLKIDGFRSSNLKFKTS